MIELDIEKEFPNAHRARYYNTSGYALCPERVTREAQEYGQTLMRELITVWKKYYPRRKRLRANLATMMNATHEEIALVHHTAEAVSVIANGIDWRPGDAIMTLDREYPSTIYPWMNLEKRFGVRLILLEETDGRVDEDAIVEAIRRERPRLFAISAVEWCTGYRFDLEKIGVVCRELDVFFFVDTAQALGFTEIDARACHASAMAGSGWKWLFGPFGTGYFYLRADLLETITPTFVGSGSVINELDYLNYDFTFLPDMRRFEYSTPDLEGIVRFDASVRFLMDVGLENIRDHVFALQDYAIERLEGLGCKIRGGGPLEHRSGIIAFRHPEFASLELSQRLGQEANIIAMERDGFIRLAFHLYNSRQGVDALIDYLRTGKVSGIAAGNSACSEEGGVVK